MSSRSNHPQRDEIDRVARLLMAAWAKSEPDHGVTLHPQSYIATFVDMARAVVEDRRAEVEALKAMIGCVDCSNALPCTSHQSTSLVRSSVLDLDDDHNQ